MPTLIDPTMPPPPPRGKTPSPQCNSKHSATPFFVNTSDPALPLSGIPIRPLVIPPIDPDPPGLSGSLSHVDKKILPANDSKSASRTYEALKNFNQRLLDDRALYAAYVEEAPTNKALINLNKRLLDDPAFYADYANECHTRLSSNERLRNKYRETSKDPTIA